MDEEGAVDDVNRKFDKRIKLKSKKDKNNKETTRGLQVVQNTGTAKAIESDRISEKEDIAEMKWDDERGQERKKNNGTKDVEADMKKGSIEVALADVYDENSSGPTTDNAGRKRKKGEKNKIKNYKFEMGNTEEVKGNESKNLPEGGSPGKKSAKKSDKKSKKQKAKRNHENGNIEEGERDAEMIGTHSENCKVDATEMVERKKKKKDKKKSNGDNFVRLQDTCSGAKHEEGDLSLLQQDVPENVERDILSMKHGGNSMKKLERKKKKYKKKENYKVDASAAWEDSVDNDSNGLMHTDKVHNSEVENADQRKTKRSEIAENGSDDRHDNEVEYANKGKKRKTILRKNGLSDAAPDKSNKKVRFSSQVEVFPIPRDSNTEKGKDDEDNLVRGKRFTPEEDEIVKEAVLKYVEQHELGDDGLKMVLNCGKYPKLKGCWKEIGSAIPHRPYIAIYCRARVLFLRSANRKWTQEEYDAILKYQEEHGNQWRALADELGKHTWHVKDTQRRNKLPNLKKGHWSQEEYQKLFDLVNTDLQLKVSEEKKSKHGMLRDNICWSAISDELSTRNQATCCLKWYKQLTSAMVAEGVWVDSDDYRLISALYSLDATCMEDVDWDDLVDNRSGDVCRKRWKQMVLHIGHHGYKSFAEQVEVLAHRYCPHLLEPREGWDSEPKVP